MLLFGSRSRVSVRYLRFELFRNLCKLALCSVWKNILYHLPYSLPQELAGLYNQFWVGMKGLAVRNIMLT